MRQALCLALSCLLLGCPTGPTPLDGTSPDASADGAITPPGQVTVGTGQLDWEDLPRTGGTVELIYGPQGGYHVWGRMRMRAIAPPDVQLSWQVVRVSDGMQVQGTTELRRWVMDGLGYGLMSAGSDGFETGAERVVLNIHCSNEVVGQTLLLRMFVRENREGGATYTDERTVTVVDVDNPVACVSR